MCLTTETVLMVVKLADPIPGQVPPIFSHCKKTRTSHVTTQNSIAKVFRMNTEEKGRLLHLDCCSQDNKPSKQGV